MTQEEYMAEIVKLEEKYNCKCIGHIQDGCVFGPGVEFENGASNATFGVEPFDKAIESIIIMINCSKDYMNFNKVVH